MGFNILGSVIVLVGLCMALDSRRLVKKYFNFGEENVAVFGMKIVGFIAIFIGGMILISSV